MKTLVFNGLKFSESGITAHENYVITDNLSWSNGIVFNFVDDD